MSFSHDIKKEMCAITLSNNEQKEACLLGMLMFLRQNDDRSTVTLNTECEETASLFEILIGEIVGTDIPVYTTTKTKNNNVTIIQKRVDDFYYAKKIYDYFIGLADCDLTDMDSYYFDCNDETFGAFCRGAFLVAGSITDPEKEYHIEITAPLKSLAQSLLERFNSLGFGFKISKRGNKYIVYSKESEILEDFITLTGATNFTLNLMNVKMMKEVKNKLNRISNCESANLNKTRDASIRQVADIKYVLEHRHQVDLSEEMLEIAELKLDDPETSLRELAEMVSTPITRSGVNHRLKKFSKLAEELRDKNGDILEMEGNDE